MHSEGYGSWFVCVCVCLSVCLSTAILALQAMGRFISNTSCFRTTRSSKVIGDFAETTAFRRYGMKTSEQNLYMLLTTFTQPGGHAYWHYAKIRRF